MEVSYCRNASGNYLVLEPEEEPVENYETKMIEKNQPVHLLPMGKYLLNGSWQLQYRISGMQSLEKKFERHGMNGSQLWGLLEDLRKALEDCTRYLLPDTRLSLEPAMIHCNYMDGRCRFVYVPGKEDAFQTSLQSLVEFILQHLEHTDHEAVEVAYQLYQDVTQEGFVLREWMQQMRRKKEENKRMSTQAATMQASAEQSVKEAVVTQEEKPKPKVIPVELETEKPEPEEEVPESFAVYLFRSLFTKKEKRVTHTEEKALRKEKKQEKKREKKKAQVIPAVAEPVATYQREQPVTDIFVTPQSAGPECFETVLMPCEDITWKKLVPKNPRLGPELVLEGEEAIIGKSAERCTHLIPQPSVSRVHARVVLRAGELFLEDCNSTNGTQVDGEILKPGEICRLTPGMEVCFGGVVYEFR